MGFLSQWKAYLDELQAQQRGEGGVRGRRLDPTVYEKVRARLLGFVHLGLVGRAKAVGLGWTD